MEEQRKAKKFLYCGAVSGGLLSLAVSLMMDFMYADTMQGTWREAIAKDLNSFFSLGVKSDSIITFLIFFLVLGVLTAFGAFMGFIFSFFLYRFFGYLGRSAD